MLRGGELNPPSAAAPTGAPSSAATKPWPGAPTAEKGAWGLPLPDPAAQAPPVAPPPLPRMAVDANVVIDLSRGDFRHSIAVATLSRHELVMSPCVKSELRGFLARNYATRRGITIIPDTPEATEVADIIKANNDWVAAKSSDYFGFNHNQEVDLLAYVQASASGVPFMTEDVNFFQRIIAAGGSDVEKIMRDHNIIPSELHLVVKSPATKVHYRYTSEQLQREFPKLRLYPYQRPL